MKIGNLYLLDPIPVWKKNITSDEVGQDINEFNKKLVDIAKNVFLHWKLEVPDEKYIDKSVISETEFARMDERDFFEQETYPAVGKWHAVPTNNFLSVDEPEVIQLKNILINHYKAALNEYYELNDKKLEDSKFMMDESWLQLYENGDYKVLHNHLRYSLCPTEHNNIWAGGYYISDGDPDKYQPYSGRFSFSTRNKRYVVKPEAAMVMMWPGDVLHEVHPFYGSSERICINFNLSTRK